eukprot:506770_1
MNNVILNIACHFHNQKSANCRKRMGCTNNVPKENIADDQSKPFIEETKSNQQNIAIAPEIQIHNKQNIQQDKKILETDHTSDFNIDQKHKNENNIDYNINNIFIGYHDLVCSIPYTDPKYTFKLKIFGFIRQQCPYFIPIDTILIMCKFASNEFVWIVNENDINTLINTNQLLAPQTKYSYQNIDIILQYKLIKKQHSIELALQVIDDNITKQSIYSAITCKELNFATKSCTELEEPRQLSCAELEEDINSIKQHKTLTFSCDIEVTNMTYDDEIIYDKSISIHGIILWHTWRVSGKLMEAFKTTSVNTNFYSDNFGSTTILQLKVMNCCKPGEEGCFYKYQDNYYNGWRSKYIIETNEEIFFEFDVGDNTTKIEQLIITFVDNGAGNLTVQTKGALDAKWSTITDLSDIFLLNGKNIIKLDGYHQRYIKLMFQKCPQQDYLHIKDIKWIKQQEIESILFKNFKNWCLRCTPCNRKANCSLALNLLRIPHGIHSFKTHVCLTVNGKRLWSKVDAVFDRKYKWFTEPYEMLSSQLYFEEKLEIDVVIKIVAVYTYDYNMQPIAVPTSEWHKYNVNL